MEKLGKANDKDKKKDDETTAKDTVSKPAQPLEEDDEFEDFPIEGTEPPPSASRRRIPGGTAHTRIDLHGSTDSRGQDIDIYGYEKGKGRYADFLYTDWQEEDTQLPGGNAHLWEESWDDDDTNEEFAVQLRFV
jgi:26 proteasome complex subunit DSS1